MTTLIAAYLCTICIIFSRDRLGPFPTRRSIAQLPVSARTGPCARPCSGSPAACPAAPRGPVAERANLPVHPTAVALGRATSSEQRQPAVQQHMGGIETP